MHSNPTAPPNLPLFCSVLKLSHAHHPSEPSCLSFFPVSILPHISLPSSLSLSLSLSINTALTIYSLHKPSLNQGFITSYTTPTSFHSSSSSSSSSSLTKHLHIYRYTIIHSQIAMGISKALIASLFLSLLVLDLVRAVQTNQVNTNSVSDGTISKALDCGGACAARCKLSKRPNLCKRACGTCCARCSCVPPGTSGNYEFCPCYATMTTRNNKLKCP